MNTAFALCPVDTLEATLEAEGLALAVCFGEIDGGEFDWDRMTWIERRA